MSTFDGSVPAPLLPFEQDRLRVLQSYCVLDTPAEPVFDDLTALGAIVFGTPVVLISLVDEHRQFFKSVIGLSVTETQRDSSFCAYTILSDEPMIVLDALEDDRFCTNPLVVDHPHIRFYAGAPLIDSNGVVLGSFCVIDNKPRGDFTSEQQVSLQRFAALATNALEQRLYPARLAEIQQEVLNANERYRLATEATTEGIWDWNCTTDELYKSARMRAIIGLEPHEAYVPLKEWLNRIHPLDRAFVAATSKQLKTSSQPSFEMEYRVKHQDKGWRWIHSRAIVLRSPAGDLIRVVGSLADITDRKFIDPLTGLKTRASLMAELDQHTNARKRKNGTFALLIVDLDLFKRINTSLGRGGGDRLLVECARRIGETLVKGRSEDILARISGDGFAILLNSVSQEKDVLAYAVLLQCLLQTPFPINDQQITMTASIGIAIGSDSCNSAEHFVQQAEAAAHQSKIAGGARNVVFSEQAQDNVLRRMSLASDLRDAVRAEALELFYQPKLNLETQEIAGFEALARWRHPIHGFVAPDEFIPIAEDGDLILELGRWTLRESIRQLSEWRVAGLVPLHATIAVNLSARQFADTDLIETVLRKLKMHDMPPSCLDLEVTERILIQDTEGALSILQRLKDLGVGLHLDDFGTGYSSLSYLQRFPFSCLKVDRSFIRDMETQPDRATLARSIIALGHALNLAVIAEGIETPEQLRMLTDMRCDYGQGYLFSRPVPAREAEAFLRAREVSAYPPIEPCEIAGSKSTLTSFLLH